MNSSIAPHTPVSLMPRAPRPQGKPSLSSWLLSFVVFALIHGGTESLQAQVWNRATTSSPIAISRNDRLIWVVNPADDSVSVIRPDNNTRLAKITVGDEPQSVALTPDNQYAYVANAAGNSVTVIQINDPAWGTFSAAVDTSVGPNGELSTGAEPWN